MEKVWNSYLEIDRFAFVESCLHLLESQLGIFVKDAEICDSFPCEIRPGDWCGGGGKYGEVDER